MKQKITNILLVVAFFIIGFVTRAQTYPVQVIPQITPPPPAYLTAYSNTTTLNGKVKLNLLLTDLTVNNRTVKLKLYIEGNGIKVQSKDFVVGAPQIFLDGGVLVSLGSAELAPYFELQNLQGISAGTYANALPEGLYQYCFEVYDVISGNKISSKSCTNVLIFLNEPPILNVPFNNVNLDAMNPQNLLFQWTPRHINVSNVVYEFSLVEIWDNTMDPQAVFLASPPLYQITTNNTNLLYGVAEPQLIEGKRYAWRVQAKAIDGVDEIGVFANNGYSEIFTFTYQGNCAEPTNLTVEEVGTKTATFRWQGDINNLNYKIAYRKAQDENGNTGDANTNIWFENDTNREEFIVIDLEPNTTYEWRVGGFCADGTLTYTQPKVFTTMAKEAEAYYNCGIEPSINISNQTLLETLQVGDVIKAGDFNVKIKEVNGSNTFTGKGYTTVGFLKNIKIALEFSNIQVNTDYQFVNGEIKTVYDPTWGNILDVDAVIDVFEDVVDVVAGDDEHNIILTYNIEESDIRINTTTNHIVITDPDGNTHEYPYDDGDTYTIRDASGDLYEIDTNGRIRQTGEGAEGGPATAANTNGITAGHTGTVGDPAVRNLESKGILITFESASDSKYALDNVNNEYERQKYHKVAVAGGTDYYPVHKAVAAGSTDTFIAKINGSNANINIDSLIFKTVGGAKVPAKKLDNSTFKLTVSANNYYKNEEAIVTYKDTDSTQAVLGSFFIHHIKNQPKLTVKLVRVNGANDIPNLQEKLNTIFKPVAGNLVVDTKIDKLTIPATEWDVAVTNGQIDYNGSGIASDYPKELRAIKDYYKKEFTNYNSKAYHIFIIDKSIAVTRPLQGFMPKTRQWGFLFEAHINDTSANESKQDKATVIAHELGHGVYNLGHPFGKDDSNNGVASTWLMDYQNGTELAYPNWAKMSDKGLQLGLFQDDEDNELANTVFSFKEVFEVGNGVNLSSIGCKKIRLNSNTVVKFTKTELSWIDKGYFDNNGYLFYVTDYSGNKYERSLNRTLKKGDDGLYYEHHTSTSAKLINWQAVKANTNNKITTKTYISSSGETKTAYSIPNEAPYVIVYFINNIQSCKDVVGQQVFWGKDNKKDCYILEESDCSTDSGSGNSNGNTSIKDFTDGLASEFESIRDLLAGNRKKVVEFSNGLTAERYNTKAILVLSADNVDGSEEKAKNFNPTNGEIKIWLHYKSRTKEWEYKSLHGTQQLSENLSKINGGKNFDVNTAIKNAISESEFEGIDIATALYKVADFLSEGISKAYIPKEWWNCNASQSTNGYSYSPPLMLRIIKQFMQPLNAIAVEFGKNLDSSLVVNPDDAVETTFALVCGLWDGFVGMFDAIPQGIKMATMSFADNPKAKKEFDQMQMVIKENGGGLMGFSKMMWEGVKSQFTGGNCVTAHAIGEFGFGIVAAFYTGGAALTGKVGSFIKPMFTLLDKLDVIGQTVGLSMRLVGKGVNKGFALVFKVGNKTFKEVKVFFIEGKYYFKLLGDITEEIVNIDWSKIQKNVVLQLADGTKVNTKIFDLGDVVNETNYRIKAIIKDAQNNKIKTETGDYLAELTDSNGNTTYAVVKEAFLTIDELVNQLKKLNWAQSRIDDFKRLVQNNPSLATITDAESWNLLKESINSNGNSESLFNKPTAIKALSEARNLPNLIKEKLGVTDKILAKIRASSSNEALNYVNNINKIISIGKKLEAAPNTNIEGFYKKVLKKMEFGNNTPNAHIGAEGILKAVDDYFDDLLKGRTIKFEQRVPNSRPTSNLSAEDLTVEIELLGKIKVESRIEIKNCFGSNCVDADVIKKQFIDRDLFNASEISEIKWKIYGQNFTKNQLVDYLKTHVSAIDGIINSGKRNVADWFGVPPNGNLSNIRLTEQQIQTFADKYYHDIFL